MHEKISWYEEIIAVDPHAKLFFSLAKLYLQSYEPEKAISTLKSGLEHHPDHFEARLLLHRTLQEQGRYTEAKGFLGTLTEVLGQYPGFWHHWAQSLEKEGRSDVAVAVRFLARSLDQQEVSWSEVLRRGLKRASGETEAAGAPPVGLSEDEEDKALLQVERPAETGPSSGSAEPYRTKTMADVLAAQGDLDQALEIYAELLEGAVTEERREMLQQRIDALRRQREQATAAGKGEKAASGRGSRRELVSRLEKLASRLESKV